MLPKQQPARAEEHEQHSQQNINGSTSDRALIQSSTHAANSVVTRTTPLLPQYQQVSVTCPLNATIGSILTIKVNFLQDQTITVQVPEGISPGQSFLVKVPLPASQELESAMQPHRQAINVKCPLDAGPGATLTMNVNNQTMTIVVPLNVVPGQSFLVYVSQVPKR